MQHYKYLICFIPSVMAVGCNDFVEPSESAVSQSEQPIINGTVATAANAFDGAVAVYHKEILSNGSYNWYQRPCSGVAINNGWAITARHCVTSNGTRAGTLIPATDVRLNRSTAPGYGSPPAGSFGIKKIHEPNNGGDPDIVLLEVGNDTSFGRDGWFTRIYNLTPQVGSPYAAFGYGRSSWGTTPSSPEAGLGAGVLRYAHMTVESVSSRMFTFKPNALGQTVASGDSGGPSFYQSISNGVITTYNYLFSIHSTAGSETWIFPALRNYIAEVALFDRPMYQFYNSKVGDHFYYSSSVTPNPSWVYERLAFRLAHKGTFNSMPLYRFLKGQHHFYTTNFAEGVNAGFTYEMEVGNVLTEGYANGFDNVVPLYRYYNPTLGDHFYTTIYGSYGGWNYEGSIGYVHAP